MNTHSLNRRLIAFLMILYCAYLAVYIYKTTFIINGERIFSLTDDMMISMTYARNFAQGHGLVWNVGGERVEAYTNPAWVLYMSLFHLLPVPLSKISLFIQISGAIFLLLSLIYVRKIALAISDSPIAVYGAVLLTMLYSHLVFWALEGTEVSLLTFLVCLIAWKVILYMKTESDSKGIYLLLGIITLVRVDMFLVFLIFWGFLIVTAPESRKEHLYYGAAAFAVFVGGQTIFRLLYYGEILPNTYYLKMTGYPIILRVARGFYIFVKFAWGMNIFLFFLPFVVLYKKIRTNKIIALLAALVVLQFLYSIYVGGDAWEERGGANRFISFVMPFFFILFAYSVSMIIKNIHLLIPVAVLSILSFNNGNLGELFLTRAIFQINLNKEMTNYSRLIGIITKPGATVAITSAGIVPYFCERTYIDQLGKCDNVIANMKTLAKYDWGSIISHLPGHMKYDHDYVLGKRKPDFISQFPGREREKAWKYINRDYDKIVIRSNNLILYFRKGSEYIDWENLQKYFDVTRP